MTTVIRFAAGAALLLICLSARSSPARAETFHTVAPGDNLYRLGLRFSATVSQLKDWNGLNSDRLVPGMVLRVAVPEAVPAAPTRAGNGEAGCAAAGGEPAEQAGADTPPGLEVPVIGLETEIGRLLKTALGFLNVRYQFGGNGKQGVDCSGLVKNVFDRHGYQLPRTAREQFQAGEPVARMEAQPGDLFFYRNSRTSQPAHVGIYLGGNRLLHASRNSRRVVVSDLSSGAYYTRYFLGARRVVADTEDSETEQF